MSRRTHPCLTCPGRTRHDNGVCAACRRRGVTVTAGQVSVPIVPRIPSGLLGGLTRLMVLTEPPANPNAPTVAELERGIDISTCIDTGDFGWDTPGDPRTDLREATR